MFAQAANSGTLSLREVTSSTTNENFDFKRKIRKIQTYWFVMYCFGSAGFLVDPKCTTNTCPPEF